MTEDTIDWEAMFKQVQEENERLRERLTKFYLAKFDVDSILNAAKSVLTNGYFWCGYFVAIIVMLLIGAFRFLKEG
jgi:hypothetical protein